MTDSHCLYAGAVLRGTMFLLKRRESSFFTLPYHKKNSYASSHFAFG